MKLLILTTLIFSTSFVFGYRINDISEIEGNEEDITEIDLSNKGLTKFPVEILTCKNLKWLSIANNGFVKVPIAIGQLTMLEHLDLSDNQNISQYDLMNIFDSCSFDLKSLDLSGSGLFFLPDGVALQRQIVKLDLSDNYLTVLPYSMMSMSKLRDVNLADNKLKDISWIANYWWGLKTIDASGNSGMNSEELLVSLSFVDNLESVTLSYLTTMPDEFTLFGAKELIIKSSTIDKFPRTSFSPKIGRLIFEDCAFKNASSTVETINNTGSTSYVGLRKMVSVDMIPFLKLKVDSIDIQSNVLSDITAISEMQDVAWLDIRGNSINQSSLKALAENKPGLKMIYSEPVSSSVGIAPPFAEYVQEPKIKKINAGKAQKVSIGKATFNFPEEAFITASGEVYTGAVKLEYTEYTSPEEIFLSGISMTSDYKDETFMLSSGGMFNIEAKDSKGNNLDLKPGKKVAVQFAATDNTQSMDTWQMNDSGVWQAKGRNKADEIFKVDKALLDSIMNQDFYKISLAQIKRFRHRYRPKIGRGERLEDFTISFVKMPSVLPKEDVEVSGLYIEESIEDERSDFISNHSYVYDGDFSSKTNTLLNEIDRRLKSKYKELRINKDKDIYRKEGPNYLPELSLTPNNEKDNFTLTFDYRDTTFNLPVLLIGKKGDKAGPKEIENFYSKYLVAHNSYKAEREGNAEKIRPLIEKQKEVLMEKAMKDEELRQKRLWDLEKYYREELNADANATSIQRVMNLSGFGLWNCDARRRMMRPTQFDHTFASVAGGMIKDEPEAITVIDRTTNGVITFKDKKEAFFDDASDNVFVVFFTATIVGVYRKWKERKDDTQIELKMIDIEKTSAGEFIKELRP
ncbi:MAG: Leucine-rich repeat (LRR) protein [Arenicella sp.]|jgi:Leucine-rich repeat (LRR) protein